jgi:hypothetical protein
MSHDAHEPFVTSASMMLLAILAIWLVLILFFVVLCRIAASADGRDVASPERYPSDSAIGARMDAAGLVLLEEQPAPIPPDLRARVRGVRGRAERYAAGS